MKAIQQHGLSGFFGIVTRAAVRAIAALLLAACQAPFLPTPVSPTATPVRPLPFITVVPKRVLAGEAVTIVGSDWDAGEEITLGLVSTVPSPGAGSIVLAVIRADPNGRFELATTIPADTSAGVWQIYAQTRTIGRFATDALTVLVPTSTPAPTPTAVPPTHTPVPTRITPTRPPRRPTLTPVPPTPVPTTIVLPPFTDWRGEYYANPNLDGSPIIVRNDAVIDFNWGYGSPDSRVPTDNFSARWTRILEFAPGTYRFTFRADDGVRMWLDNVLVLDNWREGAARDVSTDVTLGPRPYSFRIEYFERSGVASIRFSIFQLPAVTPSPLPTATPTPLPPSPTATPLPPTAIPPTATPTPIPTRIPPTATPTPTPIPVPTLTPTPIPPATPTRTPTPRPTDTPTPRPTDTPTPRPADTPTPQPTDTPTPRPTDTPTPRPTDTPTPQPTDTPTPQPTDTPTPRPTDTPTPQPTDTPTPTETPEPTATPTVAPPTATPTPTRPLTATAVLTDNVNLRVTGSGWPPNSRLSISLSESPDGDEATLLGRVRTNRNGRFTFSKVLDEPPAVPVYVVVEYNPVFRLVVPVEVVTP